MSRFSEHREEAFWENYEFLKEQGLDDRQIAARLGVRYSTLLKWLSEGKRGEGA